MSKTYKIAVIAGDGIGQDVMPEGLRVLQVAAEKFDIHLTTNPSVAEFFATDRGPTSGYVYELKIPCDGVNKNTFNNKAVTIDGKCVSED